MHPNKNKLIINADDFGLSPEINKAVIYSLEKGYINSASLMTNTPGFEEAVEYIKEKAYLNCIGIHVNLTEGKPLTNFSNPKYLNEDGTWNKKKIADNKLFFDSKTRNEISSEIIAQIQLAEKRGIRPSHINSHHHIHTLPALFFLFLNICRLRSYKLRIAQTNFNGNYLKFAYRKFINSMIKKSGLNFSDYFETVTSYNFRSNYFAENVVEIMTHPAFTKNAELTDLLSEDNSQFIFKCQNTIQ